MLGSGLAFPLGVDHRGGIALARGDEDIEQAIAADPGHCAGRAPDASRVRLRCPRPRVRHDRRGDDRRNRRRDPQRARPMGAADRGGGHRLRPDHAHDGALEITHRISDPRHQPAQQPRVPVLRDPRESPSEPPQVQLDDRRFQDLVDEARLRIASSCPEWTEHNVSDPGITLIELFAWMTDMLVYRLNRIPDKLHVALLELLGVAAPRSDSRPDPRALPAGGAARADARDPGGHDGDRDAAHRQRRVDRVPGERAVRDPPAAADRVPGPARRALQDGCGRGRHRQAPGPRPAPVRQPARGQRRALPRLRRGHLQPAAPGRDRRVKGPGRRRRSRGPAAALGDEPGRRPLGRRRSAVGPHRRVQLRLRHRRGPMSRGRRRRLTGRALAALAALPDRRR